MAKIECHLTEDGKLTPSAIEFEPGDTIEFDSDHPVHVQVNGLVVAQARGSVALADISIQKKNGEVFVLFGKSGTTDRTVYDLRVETPGGGQVRRPLPCHPIKVNIRGVVTDTVRLESQS